MRCSAGGSYLMPQKGYLNLGFYHGAALPDPDGLLEGSGKALRHVKLASLDEVGSLAVRRLIESAIDERRSALGV